MLKRKTTIKTSGKNRTNQTPDKNLLVVIVLLSLWGTIMVYSGSVLVAFKQGKRPFHFFMLQLIWTVLGFVAGYVAYRINYKALPYLAVPGIIVTFFALIFVLMVNLNNPIKRWINIGGFTFQPSEMAKLVFFIYLSSWLAKIKPRKGEFKEMFKTHFFYELLPFLFLLGLICVPIIVQPDLDTTVLIASTSFLIYFISGSDWVHFFSSLSLSAVMVALAGVLVKVASYRFNRVINWWQFWSTGEIQNPTDQGYQLRQILVAVASGSFFGVGFGESRQKFHYLGETAFTDTIFAIFAEEFGLFGSMILIGIYVYIFLKGIKIAANAKDVLGYYLALSITFWITLQAFMHIASNVALIPINGNTLPFMSYGGSSTLFNLIAAGLLLNISKNQNQTR